MKFTKMHGIGNDYVYVNCFQETVENPAQTARFVSDRHFGIGADGLILIKPSDVADCEMEMYNMDGSLGAMCGNGIRCVAKYVYDYGIVKKDRLSIATGSGIKHLQLTIENGKVSLVRVNMGAPVLQASAIPVLVKEGSSLDGTVINVPIEAAGKSWRYTAVSMGNPHAVIFLNGTDHPNAPNTAPDAPDAPELLDPDLNAMDLEKTGPAFEHHPSFPDRINTEFVRVLDRHTLQMRVWERGSGETLACGTGACAVTVAAVLNSLVDAETPVTVKLLGGDLQIFWDRRENQVYMTGPATVVFDGVIDLSAALR